MKKLSGNKNQHNWYGDRYQFVVVQRNILILIAVISLLVSIISAYSVLELAPLKSVEPFVIQVDERTGRTEVVTSATITELSDKQAIDNFNLWRYVVARESLGKTSIYHNDEVVRVLSSVKVYNQYRSSIDPQSNPDSYYAQLGNEGRREVYFTSLVPQRTNDVNNPEKAVDISFEVIETDISGRGVKFNKIARIEYAYAENIKLKQEDRLLNPLGFQVRGYYVTDARIGGVRRR